jgi:hypothetical protein
MAGNIPYCSRQKGFRKHLILECRKCKSKKGCRTFQLYLYPEEALNFKDERLLNLDFRGILWTDMKGVNENAN